jgi:hypothetical protein
VGVGDHILTVGSLSLEILEVVSTYTIVRAWDNPIHVTFFSSHSLLEQSEIGHCECPFIVMFCSYHQSLFRAFDVRSLEVLGALAGNPSSVRSWVERVSRLPSSCLCRGGVHEYQDETAESNESDRKVVFPESSKQR